MNTVLKDLVGHNNWATATLLAFCDTLTDEQLHLSAPGVYGDVLSTLEHMVASEVAYFRLLTGQDVVSPCGKCEGLSLAQVQAWAVEIAPCWLAFLTENTDVDQFFLATGDSGQRAHFTYGVALAQVFNHANVHREQVCSILTAHGVETPEIDPWAYSFETGRGVIDE